MMGSLYDALRHAQVPDDVARKAAEEVAGYESQIAAMRSDIQPLKWMIGANIGLTFVVLGRLFIPV